jgi:hypothetical protein
MNVEVSHKRLKRSLMACANMALVVLSIGAGILLVELGYRLAGYAVTPQIQGHGMAPRFYYRPDPVNGYDIAENFSGGYFEFPQYISTYGAPFPLVSNSLGCRDRSFKYEDQYVLTLGDSLTWGYVSLEETWGAILEQHIGVRVLKCGVGGYGPLQERQKLNTVAAKAGRPRLVVVGYTVVNDLMDDYLYPQRTVLDGYMVTKVRLADAKQGGRIVSSDEELQTRLKSALEKKPEGFIAALKNALADHSVLYDQLRKTEALRRVGFWLGFSDLVPAPSGGEVFRSIQAYPWLDKAWEEHLVNIKQLKTSVQALGADFLVVIIPNADQIYTFLRPPDDSLQWEYPNKRLTELFQREGIQYLDLMPEFGRYARHDGRAMLHPLEDLYWPNDGHPNVKGNLLTGLLISRYVLDKQLLVVDNNDERLAHINHLLVELSDVAWRNPNRIRLIPEIILVN